MYLLAKYFNCNAGRSSIQQIRVQIKPINWKTGPNEHKIPRQNKIKVQTALPPKSTFSTF